VHAVEATIAQSKKNFFSGLHLLSLYPVHADEDVAEANFLPHHPHPFWGLWLRIAVLVSEQSTAFGCGLFKENVS